MISLFCSYTDSIPKIYFYTQLPNETKAVLVMELLGKNLEALLNFHQKLSEVTVMRIGIQLVNQIGFINLSN